VAGSYSHCVTETGKFRNLIVSTTTGFAGLQAPVSCPLCVRLESQLEAAYRIARMNAEHLADAESQLEEARRLSDSSAGASLHNAKCLWETEDDLRAAEGRVSELEERMREIADELWSALMAQPPVLSQRQHAAISRARDSALAGRVEEQS
jgi:hypothetical protein